MERRFEGWHRENQPVVAGINGGKLEHIAKEGSVTFWVLGVDNDVCAVDHSGGTEVGIRKRCRRNWVLFYEREQRTLQRQRERLADDPSLPAITRDGNTLEVAANASSAEELKLAFENGADGIGLFRTEMSFLERDGPPSEEEQFAIYLQAARLSAGRPVIIRTLALGGDKAAQYLN